MDGFCGLHEFGYWFSKGLIKLSNRVELIT
jgi:hypothetical protein